MSGLALLCVVLVDMASAGAVVWLREDFGGAGLCPRYRIIPVDTGLLTHCSSTYTCTWYGV